MIRKAIIVVLTTLSLLMSWSYVDSFRRRTRLDWFVTERESISVVFTEGAVVLFRSNSKTPSPWRFRRKVEPIVGRDGWVRNLTAFRLKRLAFKSPARLYPKTSMMPMWLPLAVFAAYPTIAFIRGPVRRHRRRKRGLCLKCGYDLTGNVTGVCSECGESA